MEDGRDNSEASSSASHLYNSDTPPVQAATAPSAHASEPGIAEGSPNLTQNHDSDSDASSDMDVSESDQEPEPLPQMPPQPMPDANGVQSTGAKRKMSEAITNGSRTAHELPKKPRLSPPPAVSPPRRSVKLPEASMTGYDTAQCPPEVWQRIFSYLPPASLGRCLRVNRAFNTCLTSTKPAPLPPPAPRDPAQRKKLPADQAPRLRRIRLVDSNNIWANARKTWFPNLPRPLARCTELSMLQLIGGRHCQLCGVSFPPRKATSEFDAGPGTNGVRVIWPFAVRMCGGCLDSETMTDISLLGMRGIAVLKPGLAHAFITKDMNFIPEDKRARAAAIPGISMSRVYLRKDAQEIEAEHKEIQQDYGDAAADEWRKGLFDRGKDAMADASKWEKWEGQLPIGSDLLWTLRDYNLSSFPELVEMKRKSAAVQSEATNISANGTTTHAAWPEYNFQHSIQQSNVAPSPQYGTTQQASMPVTPWQFSQPAIAKNPPEVEQRRQARKQEIERRCQELDPPIASDALQYMDSFRAAMQIPRPLTDADWKLLKPRILDQRYEAELAAYEKAQQYAFVQSSIPSRDALLSSKPSKETFNKDYTSAQAPLRERLGEYVEEYINVHWKRPVTLDRDTSPVFAARALMYVQQRYTEDLAAGAIPKAPVPVNKGRQDEQTTDPFLSLDNMKWAFDNRVRPYIARDCTGLFLCAGCIEDDPKNERWAGFESLIQHYSAMHTDDFRKGNIAVIWQVAAWPQEPPFHPKPEDFIRPKNQKFPIHRGRGNVSNPAQRGRNGSSHTSGAAQHTGPHNGSWGRGQGHSTPSWHQHNNHAAPYGHFGGHSQAFQQAEEEPVISDETKVTQLAADAREVWDMLEGVSGMELLNCVRVLTVLHHATARFRAKYKVPLTLDDYTAALAMSPAIKSAGGLACHQCVSNQPDGSGKYDSYYNRIKSVKLYDMGALLKHFNIIHRNANPHADIQCDVIEMPEAQVIRSLANAPGMDDPKLKLISEAFSGRLPEPLIKKEGGQDVSSSSWNGAGVVAKRSVPDGKKQQPASQSKKKRKRGRRGGSVAREESQDDSAATTQEHEYDPTKPMKSKEQEEEEELARFDTDVSRKKTAERSASAGTNFFGLSDETMRFIQAVGPKDNSYDTTSAQTARGYRAADRAPSVGREDYPLAAAPAPPPTGATNATPDISAILAALQGGGQMQPQPRAQPQPQHRTPPENNRDSTASRPPTQQYDPGADALYRSLSTAYGQDRSPAPAYSYYQHQPPPPQPVQQGTPGPLYRAPAADHSPPSQPPAYDPLGSDLRAALDRNTRHFAYNQQQAYSPPAPQASHYAQQQYAPQQYAPPAHTLPPQYAPPAPAPAPPQQGTRYFDEEGREIHVVGQGYYAPPPPHSGYGEYRGGHYGSGY